MGFLLWVNTIFVCIFKLSNNNLSASCKEKQTFQTALNKRCNQIKNRQCLPCVGGGGPERKQSRRGRLQDSHKGFLIRKHREIKKKYRYTQKENDSYHNIIRFQRSPTFGRAGIAFREPPRTSPKGQFTARKYLGDARKKGEAI